ncbi:hypothetical protein N7541_005965 [Penicillium brevicompactum]|uniref:TauD/TfdA-like domain-containing protein n=1 Tax=Penicillium brevicompactum TaxID=5074 RepID=A0A9W9R7A6_PENBR|nr:hypothetical protein N7541_005965 [Penicillium brevicompactum]
MTRSAQTAQNEILGGENNFPPFTAKSPGQTQNPYEPFRFDGQKDTRDFGLPWSAPFPAAIKVVDIETIPQAVSLIRTFSRSGQLRELVKSHGGAILIRGLPLKTPSDYSKVAHAFGLQPHVEVGRPPLRTVLAPNVKTANEGPPELPIWPHNEYGWSTINPSWLTFSALEIPTEGGATPITSSIYVVYRLSILAPHFVEKLQKLGVKYTYRYTVNQVISNTGASIREAYGVHVKDEDDEDTARQKIEAEVRRHSNRFEWHDDGSLSVTHVVPAIRIHQPTGAPIFFGNITSAWGRSRHHGATRPPFRGDDGSYHPPPQFGDGTPMDVKDLDLLLDIAERSAVDITWNQGDLVILDNFAVQHSRQPWKGTRLVLAALWEDEGRVEDFPEGRELLSRAPRFPIIEESIQ